MGNFGVIKELKFPIVKIAILFAMGIIWGKYYILDVNLHLILFGFSLLLNILLLFTRKLKFFSLVAIPSFLVFCMGSIAVQQFSPDDTHSKNFRIKGVMIEGSIDDINFSVNNKQIILDDVTISNPSRKLRMRGKLLVSLYDLAINDEIAPGDTISFKGDIRSINGKRNPGDMDFRLFMAGKGIIAGGTPVKEAKFIIKSNSDNYSGSRFIYSIRSYINWSIEKYFGKSGRYSGLAKALILGERSDLDNRMYSDFREGGIVHILAVSGLHTGYIVLIMLFLTGRFGLRLRLLLSISGIVLFVFISGSNPPVIRAAVMCIVYMTGIIFSRESNPFNSLAIAFILILLFEPVSLFHVGFQLSFFAVFGILLVNRYLQDIYKKYFITGLNRKIIAFFAATIFAQLFTLPILFYHIGYISLTGIINNIFAIPLAGVILISIFLTLITGMVSSFVASAFASAGIFLIDLLNDLVIFSNKILTINLSFTPSIMWILIYFLVIVIILNTIFIQRPLYVKFSTILLALCCFIIWSGSFEKTTLTKEKLNVIMLDVGQGDSYLVITPKNKTILYDTGNYLNPDRGEKVIAPLLRRFGIKKIDYTFISHLDADHAGGLISLVEAGYIDSLYLPRYKNESKYFNFVSFLKKNNVTLVEFSPKIIKIGNAGIYILRDSLQNNSNFISENDRSGVIRLVYGNVSFLFTGDAGELVEEKLLAKYSEFLASDVLKVSHHGSKYGTSGEFLNAVSPRYALISCGKNNRYGHPATEVLDRLDISGTKVLRTDNSGAVILETDGKTISINNWKEW